MSPTTPTLITTPDDRYASRCTIRGHWGLYCTGVKLKGLFAGMPAPTGIAQFLWERVYPRRGP
ncbi:protein of unknown function [Pseudomonas sp. JV551A1]|nr:protein of unknown function [Pseudomonas sp. JV551A1]